MDVANKLGITPTAMSYDLKKYKEIVIMKEPN